MRGNVASAALGLMIGVLATSPASAWNRGNVQVLTVLPGLLDQSGFQTGVKSSAEGLTVGLDGNIYVTTFGFNTQGPTTGPANLIAISPNGKIVNQVPITCAVLCPSVAPGLLSPHMLGLRFNPMTKDLWVLDFGDGLVLDVDPKTGIVLKVLAGPISGSGLNALTFDSAGNGYVSDSFNGAIWKIGPTGGVVGNNPWVLDPLLGNGVVNGVGTLTPPFGANGVEFSKDGSTLFVANTAYHQIIQIPVSGGAAGTPSIFVSGINAPDGIAIDSNNNMWICANQEDEIVVTQPFTDVLKGEKSAKVIAKLGDFGGIDPKGIVSGLLFPASLAFSPDGQWLYVTNLTLYLPYADGFPGHVAIDSAWTLQVNGYTVSRLPAKIPLISGD
jgi:sugar lactone lactonase YvrE